MKILKYSYIWTLAVTFTLSSCEKFLEIDPRISTSDQVTINDENSAHTAVRGIYNQLQSDGYYGYTFQTIGFFSGDNIEYTGSQIVNQSLTNHSVRADLPALATAWTAIYNTINRANNVIAKVPALSVTPTFTDAVRNQLVGEAYFLRALSYFDLGRTWGGVQLVLVPTSSSSNLENLKRSSLADTYRQVLADLIKAEELLPNSTNRIRATRKTVWALRARYHLYREEWKEAITYASKLIDDKSNYNLLTPYSSFFADNASGTNESILELYYTTNVVNTQAYQWQPSTKGGVGWIRPSMGIVNLLNNKSIAGTRQSLISKVVLNGVDNWFGNLYYRTNGTDPAYLIRIAELYLIRAEAYAQDNDIAKSLADLNVIRKRADIQELNIADKATLLLAIEQENRIEFAFENHRWYDLVRTRRAKTVLGIDEDFRLLLPIPYAQILIDKNLEQNPQYK
ncbi:MULTISPECIES: RagB/SusD family nutrient uptake outer membrane protein [unclassified Sphingobacterium]|uniref:RagB/SusD family nutrient uptake outer membrane protein n=1 Tax=unclassified Sphingobacterium TaxID=2609468 RepID=UPI00143C7F56|nr:RagB/SusD family nutrient uptake outer membrane protein [Sphingobacterium sp. B16(2022)]NJI74166.1 RagB/SusD family nutrient uptake outer membrane protein [Sphingobacterium sp. B16(2022)]